MTVGVGVGVRAAAASGASSALPSESCSSSLRARAKEVGGWRRGKGPQPDSRSGLSQLSSSPPQGGTRD